MRLLLILLLTLQINSLKADEIFNLLKIPNLEVYKLNSSNGLKYLNAKKNFKIGFENNIRCNKANKKNLDKKYFIISKNLSIYEKDFLNKINLRFVVLCENLYISEINTAGIPDHKKRTLILLVGVNKHKYVEVIVKGNFKFNSRKVMVKAKGKKINDVYGTIECYDNQVEFI